MVLFAVGAFAATFTLRAEDIASGADDVESCATDVDVDFTTAYNNTTDVYETSGATIRFLTSAGVADTGCDGFDATLTVATGATTSVSSIATEVTGSSATVAFTTTSVSSVVSAAVLVDGQTLLVDPTP